MIAINQFEKIMTEITSQYLSDLVFSNSLGEVCKKYQIEQARSIYKTRVAMYADTKSYQNMKALMENLKNEDSLSELDQYLRTNPSSRFLSKELLKQTITNLLLIKELKKITGKS